MSPSVLGVEGDEQGQGQGNGTLLTEQNYLGLMDCSSVDSTAMGSALIHRRMLLLGVNEGLPILQIVLRGVGYLVRLGLILMFNRSLLIMRISGANPLAAKAQVVRSWNIRRLSQELKDQLHQGNVGSQRKYNHSISNEMVRLPPGTVDSWDLLKKSFIQRYCPPLKTAKQLKEIRNFKQEGDETLYQAWERYNDILYKFPTHDINSHQKVNIFYNGLGTMNRQMLDSKGPIPGMTPAQALTAI
ncbi:hypothetical protein Tco_1074954 [Tanacetum coccineum]